MTTGRGGLGLACLCLLALAAIAGPGSAVAAENCPNAKYRTGPSLFLPECRAYELVTPQGKTNLMKELNTPPNMAKVADSGERMLYQTAAGPLADDAYAGMPGVERADRTPTGWKVERATSPIAAPFGETLAGMPHWVIPSENLDKVLFTSGSIFNPKQKFVGRASWNGAVHLSDGVTDTWVSEPTWSGSLPADGTPDDIWTRFVPVGGSSDLSTVYFSSFATLTPEDATSGRAALQSMAVYKYENGQLSNAGVLPDGSLSPGGSVSAERVGQGVLGSPSSLDNDSTLDHPVSRDGKRLLFVSPDPVRAEAEPSLPRPQLYMAVDGKPSILISAPEGAGEPIAGTAGVAPTSNRMTWNRYSSGYAVATPDQSVVVFSTKDALTGAAEAASPEVFKTYRYETSTGALTYLPELNRTSEPLAKGPREHGMVVELSESGNSMLYVTEGGLLRLWRKGKPTLTVSEGVDAQISSSNTYINAARFSGNEQVLAINSTGPLRGNPNHIRGEGTNGFRLQVYRYTVADDALECISCKPGGSATGAVMSAWGLENGYASSGGQALAAWSTRSMTADGSTIYFTTKTPLVEADHNSVDDVYQWHDGQLRLISTGASGADASVLYETTPSGRDVFIVSDAQLSEADTDDVYDIYDVRVDGGFDPPQPAEAPCSADECQGPPAPVPAAPSMGSASLNGPGDGHEGRRAHRRAAALRATAPKSVKGTTAVLRVNAPGPGRLTVAGRLVKRTARSVPKAGAYRIKVALTGAGKRKLHHGSSLRTGLRVSFKPRSGAAARRTLQVTFKQRGAKGSPAANPRKGR